MPIGKKKTVVDYTIKYVDEENTKMNLPRLSQNRVLLEQQ